MNINLKNAISHFYPNPSYEQVYFEAIANSIDAGADEIFITIKIEAFDKPETLEVEVRDNGSGFTDKKFGKFSNLLDVEQDDHKGLGRLVYLAYFDEVQVVSFFDKNKRRDFLFSGDFKDQSQITNVDDHVSGTTLQYRKFSKSKVYNYDYLKPKSIKESLIRHFFPLLFKKKHHGKSLRIEIILQTETSNKEHGFFSDTKVLTLEDVPDLEKASFQSSDLDFFQKFDIHYGITNDPLVQKSIVTAICIDGRTVHYELATPDALPNGYQAIFLFYSEYFTGKTDTSRQKLNLPNELNERILKKILRKEIAQIINKEIPAVTETNKRKASELEISYPHLDGYFEMESVGLMKKEEVLEGAQRKFFSDQKKILECSDLDDNQYEKALDLSARALMEYILYRTRIIKKLKDMNPNNSEGEIHDLIVPRRNTLTSDGFDKDLYTNNVWMLDDKYMSYNTILSDQNMSKVIKEITFEDVDDIKRPDITIVFSGDPTITNKVDVVIVELKKQGLKLAKNEEVVSQLKQRARKLLKYYPNKIERIWFYGITDIDIEFRRSLKEDGFKELFSHGRMYYKSQPIIVDNEENPFPIDLYVLTYDTFINDAESRNATFLKVLKNSITKISSKSR